MGRPIVVSRSSPYSYTHYEGVTQSSPQSNKAWVDSSRAKVNANFMFLKILNYLYLLTDIILNT